MKLVGREGDMFETRPRNHNIIEVFRQLLEDCSMARIVRIELLSLAVIRLDHFHARREASSKVRFKEAHEQNLRSSV